MIKIITPVLNDEIHPQSGSVRYHNGKLFFYSGNKWRPFTIELHDEYHLILDKNQITIDGFGGFSARFRSHLEWCENNVGPVTVVDGFTMVFNFENENDATMFYLRFT